ncbi:PREDICTED: polyamine-modulated factor 1-binding protein 1 isoform X2 [Ficedula albicollis]|uniref:polyamine-modulated factor 1-binding protein 1 isoform X2 n=1 Tax=Ficedula albicollis TaxID=59894 RepID=UPI00035969D6|nr:PREDICTED: polyamine-modulated factor 1-binding protein 1 isoform X2 [Ficedula albicollis]
MVKSMAQEGCGEDCGQQQEQVLLRRGPQPHRALPCSSSCPRPGLSCGHQVLLAQGVAVPVPWDVREWPKYGTSGEVPAPQDQPEGSCRGLPGAKETLPELTSSIQQLQQETQDWQPKDQRQALVLEPQDGEPRACQDTQQEDLDPAQMLAMIEALQLDLDFCRETNHKQLVQLQEQERAVEQEHQELVILTQQFQALLGKISDASLDLKDQAVQTEVTSYLAAHSDFDSSHDIPPETRELLKQLGAQGQSQGLQHSPARLPEQMGATQAQEQQGLQQLSRDKEAIQGLHQKVAELQQQLCWQVQDMENLQAELDQAQQESAKQAEKIAAYKTHRQQLHRQLRKMQSFKEQNKQKTSSLQERLQELSSLVQHWQQLHLDRERTLAQREEELVVCKVELAFLKEELSKKTKQVQDTNRHSRTHYRMQEENLYLMIRTPKQPHKCEQLKKFYRATT